MTPPLSSPTWDIIGVGSCAVDDRLYVDHFPNPDEKMPIRSSRRMAGGQTSTALVAAAHMGSKVTFVTCLGEDELSRFIKSEMAAHGVDCSLVFHIPGSRPYHAVIIVDTSRGHRSILYTGEGVVEADPQAIAPEWIGAARVVLLDHNTPLAGLQAAILARQMNIPVVADIERATTPQLEALLDTVDHPIVNMQFGRAYTGMEDPQRILQAILRPHQAACVLTCGSAGCWFSERGGSPQHFPAYTVPVADTTGCGDVFHGAYASLLARGASIRDSIAAASAAAALKASSGDSWNGIPGLEAIHKMISETV